MFVNFNFWTFNNPDLLKYGIKLNNLFVKTKLFKVIKVILDYT
jgi:hypothetical protein